MCRKRINPIKRFEVFNRDGWRCFYCGEIVFISVPKAHDRHATVDHLVAVASGGSNTASNLVTACFRCNTRKSSQPVEDFRKAVQREKLLCLAPTFYGESVSECIPNVNASKTKNKEKIMANVNEIYGGGDFLKAGDLQGKRVAVVIESWDVQESFGSKQIVLDFVGKDKRFSLNKTNARMITQLLKSDDPDEWIGKAISLRPDKTQNPEGALVDCIRVDFELPEQPRAQAASVNPNSFGVQPHVQPEPKEIPF